MWKKIEELREVSWNFSGRHYPFEYAKKNKMEKKADALATNECYRTVHIPELVELKLDKNNDIIYHVTNEREQWQEETRYKTSLGVFEAVDHGEFGGWLTLPNGGNMTGRTKIVFECFGKSYVVMSCGLLMDYFTLHEFTKDFSEKKLYVTTNTPAIQEFVSFKALYRSPDAAYIFASGQISHNFDTRNASDISYLFKITENDFEQITFGDIIFRTVKSMVVQDNQLYLGLDKIVAKIDIESQDVKYYTPLSYEAEDNLTHPAL